MSNGKLRAYLNATDATGHVINPGNTCGCGFDCPRRRNPTAKRVLGRMRARAKLKSGKKGRVWSYLFLSDDYFDAIDRAKRNRDSTN